MYKAFLRVVRIWNHLTMEKRSGQAFSGFDEHFPYRPRRSLIVRCAACPERGMNVDEKMINLSEELR